MASIKCEITFILICSKYCFLVGSTVGSQNPKFTIIDTKLYVQAVALSTQDNVKLLKPSDSGLKEQLIEIKLNLK